MAPFELTPDLLAAQGQALRRLARSLLVDAHAAEDVVQETWVACLRRPGLLPDSVSAWLTAVTRRMALRRVRDDGRRREREGRRAVAESSEAQQERGLEREEALRGVTLALLGLDEPFKTALILRYYENRTPAEIAAELGVPLATVKSRLARGLEKLRETLARELGPERRGRALALLAGAPAALGGTTATIGGLLVGAKAKAAVAVAVLAGGLFLALRVERAESAHDGATEPSSARAEAASVALSAPTEPAPRPRAPVDEAPRRELVGGERAPDELVPPFPSEPSHVQQLVGRVRDARDLPLAGAQILLAPQGLPFHVAATTDDEGRFALRFATRRPVLRCALQVVDAQGQGPGPREIELVAGQPFELDLALHASGLQQSFSLYSSSDGLFELALAQDGLPQLTQALVGGRALHQRPEMAAGSDGLRVFVEPWPPVSCPATPEVEIVERLGEPMLSEISVRFLNSTVDGGLLSFEFGGALVATDVLETLAAAEEAPRLARVRGVVRDAGGRLLAGVEVGYGPPGRRLVTSVVSDEQGAFELTDVPPGEWRLRALGPVGEGRCDELVTLVADEARSWNPLLERGHELTGRVLLPDGTPLAARELELWSSGPGRLYRAVTRTNEDGRFAFEHLAVGSYELHVGTDAALFPVRVVTPVLAPGDLGTLQLEPRELALHTLTLALEDADGERLPSGEVRLWHVPTGRALARQDLDERGVLTCAGLPGGPYRVEAGGPLGWRDLGTTWIEEDLDLGRVRFARPGVLSLARAAARADEPRVAASLWSVHPDVLARLEQHTELVPVLHAARAGDYLLCLDAGEARQETALTITSGRTTALEFDGPRPPRPAEPPFAGEPLECVTCHAGAR